MSCTIKETFNREFNQDYTNISYNNVVINEPNKKSILFLLF